MINEKQARRYCSEAISLIENYNEAVDDKTQTWDLHHRREIDEGLSGRELIRRKEYLQRHASELIFLKHGEHIRLHKSGGKHHFFDKNLSEEHKKKLSQALSGEKSYLFGKHLQEETKKKLSQANLGKQHSERTKKKMSEAHLGRHWYNNGVKSVLAKSCPEGFVEGRLK